MVTLEASPPLENGTQVSTERTWKEKLANSRDVYDSDPERAKIFEMEKEKSLPIISRDLDKKEFEPVRPQPVISKGIYEAEFSVRGKDVLFHFWPYGYHEADDLNKVPPRFHRGFQQVLRFAMEKVMSPSKVELSEDRDMGAWFVKVVGLADNPFHRELSIKACEAIHKDMGGTDS